MAREEKVLSLDEARKNRVRSPQNYRRPTRGDIISGREVLKMVSQEGLVGGMRLIPVYLDKEPLEDGNVYYHEGNVLKYVSLKVFLYGGNDFVYGGGRVEFFIEIKE